MIESHADTDGKSVSKVTINDLLGLPESKGDGLAHVHVTGIAYRADAVRRGDAFFCIPGAIHDGHDFAGDAAAAGASVLVVERVLPGLSVPQCLVADSRRALAIASSAFHGNPSASMNVVGITGTNGKTTTTYLLDSIMRAAGHTTGVIGTVETRVAGVRLPATRTTPESSDLQALLAQMRDAGVTAVSMEVSSHAIDLKRVAGVTFAAVGFTNLTQDHLDYHGTLTEYGSVKRRLFTESSAAVRMIDVDDPFGRRMADDLVGSTRVGRAADADVRAEDEVCCAEGTTFTLVTPHGTATVRLPLAGAYNVSNALLAAGCALGTGVPFDTVVQGLEAAEQVPGRLERIDAGQPFSVLVDYAHTPDSLEKAIRAIKRVTSGRTIVVFGCGGDRDPAKRPLMGKAAADFADLVVVTSDNPRSEDPSAIISQVLGGFTASSARPEVEVDRRVAIARAIALAVSGDSVLIAGKGHEDYQIFADKTVHFDDREVAFEELKRRC